MLDHDLAAVYGVSTKRLNEQVQRNIARFPADFMFRLNAEEAAGLGARGVSAAGRWGGRRYLPLAFTEHGAVMLAAVLKSAVAVRASVAIARAFVALRRMAFRRAGLEKRFRGIEGRLDEHEERLKLVFEAVNSLGKDEDAERREIGFRRRAP